MLNTIKSNNLEHYSNNDVLLYSRYFKTFYSSTGSLINISVEGSPLVEVPVVIKLNDITFQDAKIIFNEFNEAFSKPKEMIKPICKLPQGRMLITVHSWDLLEKLRNEEFAMFEFVGTDMRQYHFNTLESVNETTASESNIYIAPLSDIINSNTKYGYPKRGSDVVIGIIDYNIDPFHPDFLDENGKTRILSYWDQTLLTSDNVSPYGKVYSTMEIQGLLDDPERYNILKRNDNHVAMIKSAHGTSVASVAAGTGSYSGVSGIATDAKLILVNLSNTVVEERKLHAAHSSHLIAALSHIYYTADEYELPCVVNMSLGVQSGAKDGSSLLETTIDSFLMEKNGRACVVSAGNSRGLHTHKRLTYSTGTQTKKFTFTATKETDYFNAFEVWFSALPVLTSLTMITPEGKEYTFKLAPEIQDAFVINDNDVLKRRSNQTIELLQYNGMLKDEFKAYVKASVENEEYVLRVGLDNRMPLGEYTFYLTLNNIYNNTVDIYVEDVDPTKPTSYLDKYELTQSGNLNALCCSEYTIAVSAFDPTTGLPTWFSSQGPTRDGRLKPEVSAPGNNMVAATSMLNENKRVLVQGTSFAAPYVAGVIALILNKEPTLPIEGIRHRLITPIQSPWTEEFGYGKVYFNNYQ